MEPAFPNRRASAFYVTVAITDRCCAKPRHSSIPTGLTVGPSPRIYCIGKDLHNQTVTVKNDKHVVPTDCDACYEAELLLTNRFCCPRYSQSYG